MLLPSLNTTFSAMRISRLCLALLPAGCSQTLLCCGWVAVLPGAIPASSARGCKSLAGAQLDAQTLLSPKQDKAKVLISGVLPALGRHWPWFSQSSGLFLFLFFSPHDNVFCFCNIICLLWWFFYSLPSWRGLATHTNPHFSAGTGFTLITSLRCPFLT